MPGRTWAGCGQSTHLSVVSIPSARRVSFQAPPYRTGRRADTPKTQIERHPNEAAKPKGVPLNTRRLPVQTPTLTEPRTCQRCDGTGTTELWIFGLGMTETRCPGELDLNECDNGLVR